eukprot:gene3090-6063_t
MDKFVTTVPRSNKRKYNQKGISSRANEIDTKKHTRDLTQMYIDIGQSNFDAKKQCNQCKMVYAAGDVEDAKRHQSFCNQLANKMKIYSLKGFQIRSNHATTDANHNNINVIVEMRNGSQRTDNTSRMSDIISYIKEDLGCSQDLNSNTVTTYVYIRDMCVIGCLIVDQISRDKTVACSSSQSTTDISIPIPHTHNKHTHTTSTRTYIPSTLNDENCDTRPNYKNNTNISNNNNINSNINSKINPSPPIATTPLSSSSSEYTTTSSDCCSDSMGSDTINKSRSDTTTATATATKRDMLLGVFLVWVDRSCRRQRVAASLLDVACRHYSYGVVYNPRRGDDVDVDVAFSQPTQDGLKFAFSMTKTEHIRVFS